MTLVPAVTIPFSYEGTDGSTYECLGWENGDPETGRVCVRLVGDDTTVTLGAAKTFNLLRWLKIDPKTMPGKKKKKKAEVVSGKDWERFLRLKESFKELEEMSAELLTNWRNHLEYIREQCGHYDDDDILEEMDDVCRRIPRMVRYIRTGHFPSMEEDDDELDHEYQETEYPRFVQRQGVPYRPTEFAMKPKKVHVIIEDISTGDL